MMKKYYFIFTLFAFIFVTSLLIIILPSSTPKPIVVVPTPTSIPAYTSTPTSVSWQTYHNDKYGFEFQYPSDLNLMNNPYNDSSGILATKDTVGTMSPGGWGGVFISVLPNPKQTKLKDFVSQYIRNNHDKSEILDVKYTSSIVNGLNVIVSSGEQFAGNREPTSRIFIEGEHGVILIDPNTEFYQTAANQILSTFKFLPQATPTLATKTETNLGYIKRVYVKDGKNYLDIDYIQWIDDASAPNHFRISNTNPQIRTFEVVPEAPITIIDYVNGDMTTKKINLSEISSRLYNLYNVKIEGGKITAISERYVP